MDNKELLQKIYDEIYSDNEELFLKYMYMKEHKFNMEAEFINGKYDNTRSILMKIRGHIREL